MRLEKIENRADAGGQCAAMAEIDRVGRDRGQGTGVTQNHRNEAAGFDVSPCLEACEVAETEACQCEIEHRIAIAGAHADGWNWGVFRKNRPSIVQAAVVEADPQMSGEVIAGFGNTVSREIGWCRDNAHLRFAELACHETGTGHGAMADGDVGPVLEKVDHHVGQHDVEHDVRMLFGEMRDERKQEAASHGYVHADPDPAAWLAADGGSLFGVRDVGEDTDAAFVEGGAFRRELKLAGRAVEQARAEALLEARDEFAHGRGGHAGVTGGGREAACVHDADKDVHFACAVGVLPFHDELNSRMMCLHAGWCTHDGSRTVRVQCKRTLGLEHPAAGIMWDVPGYDGTFGGGKQPEN